MLAGTPRTEPWCGSERQPVPPHRPALPVFHQGEPAPASEKRQRSRGPQDSMGQSSERGVRGQFCSGSVAHGKELGLGCPHL